MKVESIHVRNYRLLECLDVDLESNLSLVIGKNNSGKTSFLSILSKFLGEKKNNFVFEDFSLNTQKEILSLVNTDKQAEEFSEIALTLKIVITYEETDSLGEIAGLILDLDANNNILVMEFAYILDYENYRKLLSDYSTYRATGIDRDFQYFINKSMSQYFCCRIRTLEYGNEDNFQEVKREVANTIISFKVIDAKRDVDNNQNKAKSLSFLAGKYYAANVSSESDFPELQKKLSETDESLTDIYKNIFDPIVNEISTMSYNPKEAEITILSTLSEKKIFQDNTTVKYRHENTLLPEDYNGLGYLNLFEIVFNMRIILDQLSKKSTSQERSTPLNILFIEEPEAHTHPQMQYIFIKNIKQLLERYSMEVGASFSLQTIVSTHSSHIVSQCDFQDIKYFYRETITSVKSRSLKNLYSVMVTEENDGDKKLDQERVFRFVKQYVTLNRAELFFADKAVLIEGDTERILISAMMHKVDQLMEKQDENYEPLLSQNISIIEVGAYSHVFADFFGFLNIKTLIITDLDCANDDRIKCDYDSATKSTNASIKYFTKTDSLKELVNLGNSPITFHYNHKDAWIYKSPGTLRMVFQKKENDYQASSFEDAFLCCNYNFVLKNKENFSGLKNIDRLTLDREDYYELAHECLKSKTSFALDLLMYDDRSESQWTVPQYIQEGLKWLAK